MISLGRALVNRIVMRALFSYHVSECGKRFASKFFDLHFNFLDKCYTPREKPAAAHDRSLPKSRCGTGLGSRSKTNYPAPRQSMDRLERQARTPPSETPLQRGAAHPSVHPRSL